jgi:hypothetical protein
VFGQSRVLPLASYFRDQITVSENQYIPVFPVKEHQVNYYTHVKDTIKRYSSVGHWLYQRELIVLNQPEGTLWITPILNLSSGKSYSDTATRIMQNTRGIRMEGLLGSSFFFSTSFYENQAILPQYAQDYVLNRGEFYWNSTDSTYSQVNGVIPGAARTKPFKSNGFDYAYATGMTDWKFCKKGSVSWGNERLFVGNGYRSLFWSDNGVPAMNLRINLQFSSKWNFQVVRMRGLNLLRHANSVNGEAYYEPTSLGFASLYFQPNKRLTIGLFEGGKWLRGDSIQKTPVAFSYYIPLPGAAYLGQQVTGTSSSLLGIDAAFQLKHAKLYGQLGATPGTSQSEVVQLGVRIKPFKKAFDFIQFEYNHTGSKAYQATNPRIHYINYQLPIAHPMGGGVDEFLLRSNFEWKNWFLNLNLHFYVHQNGNYQALLPTYQTSNAQLVQTVNNHQMEIGYRFNRAYGFEVWGGLGFRSTQFQKENTQNTWISFGIRTQLTNHYFDF